LNLGVGRCHCEQSARSDEARHSFEEVVREVSCYHCVYIKEIPDPYQEAPCDVDQKAFNNFLMAERKAGLGIGGSDWILHQSHAKGRVR